LWEKGGAERRKRGGGEGGRSQKENNRQLTWRGNFLSWNGGRERRGRRAGKGKRTVCQSRSKGVLGRGGNNSFRRATANGGVGRASGGLSDTTSGKESSLTKERKEKMEVDSDLLSSRQKGGKKRQGTEEKKGVPIQKGIGERGKGTVNKGGGKSRQIVVLLKGKDEDRERAR